MCQLGPGWILILRAILMGAGLVQVRLFLFLGKLERLDPAQCAGSVLGAD